ncbi:MAG TPA: phosphatase PAP2 family protein [Leptolinea sp.]
MKKTKRFLIFGLFLVSQAIYLPLNKFLQGGVALKLPLDNLIPIIPWWSLPYVLWMFCWFWLWFWASMRMPDGLFKVFSTSALIVILSSMLFFAVFPTFVLRNPVKGTGFGADLLRYVYASDGLYCAFPSGHIYLCTLTALFFSRWHPRSTWLWGLVFLTVTCSTLFTGQHYILDIVGGLIFAFGGTYLGTRLTHAHLLTGKKSSTEQVSF